MGCGISLRRFVPPKAAGENEIRSSAQAQSRPDVIPGQLLIQYQQGKGDKHRECDYLLQELELVEGDAPRNANAVGRNLQEILEESDPPAYENGQRDGFSFQKLQLRVEIPRAEHEEVGGNQQNGGFEEGHNGRKG